MAKDLDEILEIKKAGKTQTDSGIPGSESDSLQKETDKQLIRKTLRSSAIGSILFGIIAIVIGFGGMEENPINAVLGIIGIFLIAEGIWIMVSPSPLGFIVDGIALILIGIWNVIVTLASMGSGGGGFSFFAVLGIWQIVTGCKSFGRYSQFSKSH